MVSENQKIAQRYVVANDRVALAEHFKSQGITRSVWETWQNKAGKSLILLAKERGNLEVQRFLELEEQVREEHRPGTPIKVGDDVWLNRPDELQPLQGTIVDQKTVTTDNVTDIWFLVQLWSFDEERWAPSGMFVRQKIW